MALAGCVELKTASKEKKAPAIAPRMQGIVSTLLAGIGDTQSKTLNRNRLGVCLCVISEITMCKTFGFV